MPNQVLGGLGLDKHPDKTFIGRVERGFDFLGYHFSPAGLSVAASTMERFVARATRLYEQERRARARGCTPFSHPLGSDPTCNAGRGGCRVGSTPPG